MGHNWKLGDRRCDVSIQLAASMPLLTENRVLRVIGSYDVWVDYCWMLIKRTK